MLSEKVKAKQPWEMTREEWKNKGIRDYGYKPSQAIEWDTMAAKVFNREAHAYHVKQALSEGKPVPRHVLEEYKGEPWANEALEKPQ